MKSNLYYAIVLAAGVALAIFATSAYMYVTGFDFPVEKHAQLIVLVKVVTFYVLPALAINFLIVVFLIVRALRSKS